MSEEKSKKTSGKEPHLAAYLGEVEEKSKSKKRELKEEFREIEVGETDEEIVYPVYILYRVVYETRLLCKKADPNEAIAVLP